MLMVILGAGASYDSVNVDLHPQMAHRAGYQLPLAKDIFATRPEFAQSLEEFRDFAPLLNRLRRAARDEVVLEEVLRDIELEAQGNRERSRQLLAIQCYLRSIIAECGAVWDKQAVGSTNYAELVDLLEPWRAAAGEAIAYVTFNYDLLLEAALRLRFRSDLSELDDYMSQREFLLFKLHGSVDWGRLTGIPLNVTESPQLAREWLFDKAGGYEPLDHFVKTRVDQFTALTDGQAWGVVPAIAVPIKDKDSFECPPAHLSNLRHVIAHTTRVITLGWRGLEANFLDMWRTRNNFYDLLVVSGSLEAGRETVSNLAEADMVPADPDIFDGGFSALLDAGALTAFLERPSRGSPGALFH